MSSWNFLLDYLLEIITLKNVIIFAVLYFFVIWIFILVWVVKDISNRTDNIYLQILSILIIILFTPFWIFLYLLIRPRKTLFEQYYLEVESNLECLNNEILAKIKALETKKSNKKNKKKIKKTK
jgi:glucan phosphoethanolaminetransferase (alkaline phosphatase superfamily)